MPFIPSLFALLRTLTQDTTKRMQAAEHSLNSLWAAAYPAPKRHLDQEFHPHSFFSDFSHTKRKD